MIDEALKPVLRELKINRFIETGTDMGETVAEVAKWFAEFSPDFGTIDHFFETGAQPYNSWNTPIKYPFFRGAGASSLKIYSVDLDENASLTARRNFASNPNIEIVNESSEKFLNRIIAGMKGDGETHVLFFLDAHWGKYWPIRDELLAIAKLDKFAVVVDDFFVPGRSRVECSRGDFGFDFYHDRILCWGYIRDCFATDSVRIFYPSRPNRDRRGWCLIMRGYSESELSALKPLNLTELAYGDTSHAALLRPKFTTYLDFRIVMRMIFPLSWLRRAHAWSQFLRPKLS